MNDNILLHPTIYMYISTKNSKKSVWPKKETVLGNSDYFHCPSCASFSLYHLTASLIHTIKLNEHSRKRVTSYRKRQHIEETKKQASSPIITLHFLFNQIE